jgi:hypothetical protein
LLHPGHGLQRALRHLGGAVRLQPIRLRRHIGTGQALGQLLQHARPRGLAVHFGQLQRQHGLGLPGHSAHTDAGGNSAWP